ncbi:MAG: HD domain-containing phosphohydrolase [Thermodesulfovibrionales bacterium]|jgi:putative nucleotidyltransferase with HDIG domain
MGADTRKESIIIAIKQKIRLLNVIAAFIVVTLLAVIFRYLFKPAGDVLSFLPDISITLVITFVVFLTIISFYMWSVVARQIISTIEKYRNRIDQILSITKDLREEKYADILLNKIMEYSLSITRSDSGSILLLENNNLVFKVVKGERSSELLRKIIPQGRGIVGWVAQRGSPLRIADVKKDDRFNEDIDALTGNQTKSALCVPLIIQAGVIGVIELLNGKGNFYSQRDEEIITYLADQAAISLARARFYEDQKNYELYVTDILLDAIDYHIPEKKGHSKRVAIYSNIMAKAINMSEENRKRLYFACLLHDVGFLKIQNKDFFKREYIERHPVIGSEMISQINFYADIAPFILYHHERYDGFGYPEKLIGEAIPLEARIISIADAFDVMLSTVSYKAPIDFDPAIEELKMNAGTQFDFRLVEEFVNNITPEQIP